MIIEHTGNVEISSIQNRQFSFEDSPIIFKILSDSLYSDKIGSIVRELSCNAVDSHKAVGKEDVPFKITINSGASNLFKKSVPSFSIRDYGTGLSEEEIYNLYTVYGASSKRNSNDYIGGYGIGSKSPFAYTKSFTITSYYNGKKTVYTAYIDSNEFPNISKMIETETEECNGLEISFLIKESDVEGFNDAVYEQLSFFEVKPVIIGSNISFFNPTVFVSGSDWMVYESKTSWFSEIFCIINGCKYSVRSKELPFDIKLCHNTNLYFNIGELDLNASREALAYTDKTVEAIKNKYESMLDEMRYLIEQNKRIYTPFYARNKNYIFTNFLGNYYEQNDIVPSEFYEICESKDVTIYVSYRSEHKLKKYKFEKIFSFPCDKTFVITPKTGGSVENLGKYLSSLYESCFVLRSDNIDACKELIRLIGSPNYVFIDTKEYYTEKKKRESKKKSEIIKYYKRVSHYGFIYDEPVAGPIYTVDLDKFTTTIDDIKPNLIIPTKGNRYVYNERYSKKVWNIFIRFLRTMDDGNKDKEFIVIGLNVDNLGKIAKYNPDILSTEADIIREIQNYILDAYDIRNEEEKKAMVALCSNSNVKSIIGMLFRNRDGIRDINEYLKEDNPFYKLYSLVEKSGGNFLNANRYIGSDSILELFVDNTKNNEYIDYIESEPLFDVMNCNDIVSILKAMKRYL